MWLTLAAFPHPPQTTLEESWNETLVHAADHHWQFGKEVDFTYGPFGYLTSPYHLGREGAAARIIWETVGKLIIASGLVYAFRRRGRPTQLAFVAGTVWTNWIFGGTFYLLVIGIAVVEVLLARDERLAIRLLCVFCLAFLAQVKFTNLLLAGFGVAVAVAYFAGAGQRRTAASLAVAFLLGLLLWWKVAGQDLGNVGPYLAASWKIASGYSDSMGYDETEKIFLTGLAIVLGWMAFVGQLALRKAQRAEAVAVAAFLAFNGFVWWKYAFVRADGHTNSLYLATLMFAIVLPGSLSLGTRLHWFWAIGLFSLLAFRSNEPALFPVSFPSSLTRLRSNLQDLVHGASLPQRWEQERAAAAAANPLPLTRALVGPKSIDVVSYQQGVALVNRLNLTPRPVFQGYCTYLPALSRLNLDFYRSGAAPDFVLWRQETIDARFPTLDDAQLLPEIPRSYAVAGREAGFLLLRRTVASAPSPLERVLLAKGGLKFRDWLRVPRSGGRPIWLQARFRLSRLGAARAAFYKPPQLFMSLTDSDGATATWRILPGVAADGFVLSPLLLSTADVDAFCTGGTVKTASTLCFTPAPGQDYLWAPTLRIEFDALTTPTAKSGR